MTQELTPVKIIAIGLDDYSLNFCKQSLGPLPFLAISNAEEFGTLFENPPPGDVLLCGDKIQGLSLMELAQSTRGQYVSAPILYVTCSREGFEKKKLIKNGFTDAFLLPLDESFLKNRIEEFTSKARNIKSYRPVKIVDLQPGSPLDFEVRVFLPQNKRYMAYTAAGENLTSDKVSKLNQHGIGSLFVSKDEMPKFYEYSANRLITLSETEKLERLQESVRDLFGAVVNTTVDESTVTQGRELIQDAAEIVNKYILNSQPSEWYLKLQQTLGEAQDSYSHTTNVSTFAGLFSIGLKMGKPEEVAMAGMFHDLGLADVPPQILAKPESERTPEEQKLYQKHPDYTLDIIRARKLIVPQNVLTAIQQHHERFDSKGYPRAINGDRMTVEAKIVSLADQFDYLTCAQEGRKRLSPTEAMKLIADSGSLDPEFMYAAVKLIPKQT